MEQTSEVIQVPEWVDSYFLQTKKIVDREEFIYYLNNIINTAKQKDIELSESQVQNWLEDKFKKKFTEYSNREEYYKADEINWLDSDFYDSWDKIKGRTINLLRKENSLDNHKLFLIGHSNDTIIGKPQMIHETTQNIPLIIKVGKKKEQDGIEVSYKFLDDRYDKRYDGYQMASLDKKFYVYRIINDDQEYLAFSETKLDCNLYTLKGMKVKMPNLSELTKTLRVRSVATVFFVKEAHSAIKALPKEELIEFTKELGEKIGFNQEAFKNITFLNSDGKIYLHSETYNLIRIAQLLSGKYQGYPLHILNIGPIGKGKTTELEALDYKFNESKGILEAGNSTPKALIPSFKEKPASPGYILSTVRVALIDELMKMIANANINGRSGETVQEHLSQLNMILEHKKRTIGSGNDNSLMAKATSKVIFCANALPGKRLLADHIGVVDASTLSRMLCVVQDQEEQNFIENNVPINLGEFALITGHTYANIYRNGGEGLYNWKGVSSNIYVLIYDSCQLFGINFDEKRVNDLFKMTCNLVEEPLKTVWKARGLHHMVLLLDGLVKYRCLFKDYDPTFTATDYDYFLLEGLIKRIIDSWTIDISISARSSY